MNKLLIPNGGMPLEGDDFRWEQEAVRDALKGIVHYFAAPSSGNLILSGCNITFGGGNAAITTGYVCINYEICFVPAQTVAVSSLANSSLKILETYDATGLEVFADSVSRDTYAIRRAIISDGLAGSNEIILATPVYLADRLSGSVQAMTSPVTSFASGFSPNPQGVSVNKIINQVLLQGVVISTHPASNWIGQLICTLPTGFRPNTIRFHNIVYSVPDTVLSKFNTLLIEVDTNGEVRATHLNFTGTAGDSISLLLNFSFTG
jgi:hypothetical protein